MNEYHEPAKTYLLTVVRMAKRLILPAAGMPHHHPYFDRLNGYDNNNGGSTAATRITEAVSQGIITVNEAMDLEMASLITSGQTDGHQADTVFQVALQASPSPPKAPSEGPQSSGRCSHTPRWKP